jgi:hypothetical protein
MRIGLLGRAIEASGLEHVGQLLECFRAARPLAIIDYIRVMPFLELEKTRHLRADAHTLLCLRGKHALAKSRGHLAAELEDHLAGGIAELDPVTQVIDPARKRQGFTAKVELGGVLRDFLGVFVRQGPASTGETVRNSLFGLFLR